MQPVLALDLDETSLEAYKQNFPVGNAMCCSIEEVLDSPLGSIASAAEGKLVESVGSVEILLGGPPCQGHSDLNNHSRRADPKNRLYERMARFAELVKPTHIIVENVPSAIHDKGKVVQTTRKHLESLGYAVDEAVIEISCLGVAQRRKRHVLVASLTRELDLQNSLLGYARAERPASWAIGDLKAVGRNDRFDKAAVPSAVARNRIDYLFDRDCHDLPDSERPKCHRLKMHSYRSVYGRMYWDKPSQTMTSGFTCMGQGRFVHPKERRTITPHEAARLQFIPDFFKLDSVTSRTALAQVIANSVPPKLTYVLALELLR